MSDRLELRGKICATLQQNYVALLGQRGSGMDGLIRSILQRPTVANMKFVQVPLPRNISNESEFMDEFIESLVNMSTRIAPRGLAEGIKRVWEDHKHSGVEYRLRKVLSAIGEKTTARPLVFILRSFAEIETDPLKALLSLFRDYHGQIETPKLPAARIRILAAGDSKLWNLCCRKLWDTSPFNIAKRLFLDGLSRRELQKMNPRLGLEAAIRLRDLTDGVPALVEPRRIRGRPA